MCDMLSTTAFVWLIITQLNGKVLIYGYACCLYDKNSIGCSRTISNCKWLCNGFSYDLMISKLIAFVSSNTGADTCLAESFTSSEGLSSPYVLQRETRYHQLKTIQREFLKIRKILLIMDKERVSFSLHQIMFS